MRVPTFGPGRILSIAAALLALPCAPAEAAVRSYRLVAPANGDAVVFTSHAPLENFKGRTNALSGSLRFDPDDLPAGIVLRVEVELAELDTGIGLRNRHMRENHLHTEEHPLAVFEGAELIGTPPIGLPAAERVSLEIRGSFLLHGVQKERTLPIDVRLGSDGTISIQSRFVVSLAEHEIPRPKFLVMKLGDEQDVEIEILARPDTESGSR